MTKKHTIDVTPIQYAMIRQIAREHKLTTAKALKLVMYMGFHGQEFIRGQRKNG